MASYMPRTARFQTDVQFEAELRMSRRPESKKQSAPHVGAALASVR